MSDRWYYRLFGEEFGPVSRDAIEELNATGMLGQSDEIRAEDSAMWQSVSRVLAESPALTSSAVEVATLTVESADDEQIWFYQFMGNEMGPVSFNELLEFAHRGQLTADDQVKYGETGKYRRVGAIGRLVAVLPYQDHKTTPPPPTKSRTPAIEAPAPPVAPPVTPAVNSVATSPAPAPTTKPAAPVPQSAPAAETVKPAPTPAAKASQPVVSATLASPPPEIIPPPKPEPPPVAPPPPRTTSTYGSSSSYGGMSSPPAWQTPAKPAFKPPPRKSSSSGPSIDFGAMLEPLKDTKTLATIGGVLGVGLIVAYFLFMPPSTGADVARLKELEGLLTEFKSIRDQKGDLASFSAKAEKVAKPIVDELKNSASRQYPAKQCLLWAARDALPRMIANAQKQPKNAEQEYENLIHDAQRILKVGNPPPKPPPTEDDEPRDV